MTEEREQSAIFQDTIQWYPGHIAKHERTLGEQLKLVDVVVEVLDARMPKTTINPRLEAKIRQKPVLLVLNKADLADTAISKRWVEYFKSPQCACLLYQTTGTNKKPMMDAILRLAEVKMKQLEAKGLKRRPVRVLVVGMPNVGKSSLINHIVGRKKTKTGYKAGVTRTNQWVRIHPQVELLDSPGIIPPVLESEEAGFLLAVGNAVGEAAFDDETVANFLLNRLTREYPGVLETHYGISDGLTVSLATIAQARGLLMRGGMTDERRAAQALLADFRQARLGRFSLERPPHDQQEEAG